MEIIELRGHHLGAIYEMVALSGGMIESEDAVREAFEQFATRMDKYPASTVEEARMLFEKVFFGECLIQIVEGLDIICNSGCIQAMRDRAWDNSVEWRLRANTRGSLASNCQNSKSASDQIAIRIHKVVVGGIYSSREIVRRIHELWRKHGFKERNDLTVLYMKENKEESDRICDESHESSKQSAASGR